MKKGASIGAGMSGEVHRVITRGVKRSRPKNHNRATCQTCMKKLRRARHAEQRMQKASRRANRRTR